MSENQTNKKSEVAQREEAVLSFWKEHAIFEQSLQKDSPKGEFVFFDGPPYATGLPHYGHLLPGTMKDVIPRFKTMQGYHVPRRWGWDCHGLPIENLIQKELDLPTKHDIVEYGIEKFNQAARASVLRYEEDWKEYIPRVGRFVDMTEPYKTMDVEYMEGVWGVFKKLYDDGLVYKGYKSMMVSPPLETVLSNQEVNLGGYHDLTDLSAIAKFTLKEPLPLAKGEVPKAEGVETPTHILAWTTTPWTLPGNVLLAVGTEIVYLLVKYEDEQYITAKALVEKVFEGKEYEVVSEMKGVGMVGMTYAPIFPYYADHANAFRVVSADFVTTEDGTGIVHIAPGFGQDDLEVGQRENVEPVHHVQMDGRFVPAVEQALVSEGYDVAGHAVKAKENGMHVDIEIVKYLAHHGRLFSKKKYVHSYPVCWRTDCPLINYATESWFIDVKAIKDKLIANNKKTHWVPEHIRDGRFGNWLEEVRDWSVSRSRFWGTPLPLWYKENGDVVVLGTIGDLKKYTKQSGNTYHAMRHGQAGSSVRKILTTHIETPDALTDEGKDQVMKTVSDLKQKNIDLIFVSPFQRTRETAEILQKELGLSDDQIIIDERLREVNVGEFNGKDYDTYHNYLDKGWKFEDPLPGNGESMNDVRRRVGAFLYEVEKSYQGKNILIISHRTPLWLLQVTADGAQEKSAMSDYVAHGNAEVRTFEFTPLSHNENYELDIHRPYIDELEVVDENGISMKRVEDIFDVWFDSGSMPYSSERELGQSFEQPERFPADFVAEGQDQTRGWFYVMMVLSTALYDQPAFKNILVNGLVLAEDGKKMSKRLQNYPDLNELINKQGADAVRLFLMASPSVHAEDVNFSEKSVAEVQSKIMGRLRNVLSFYELYKKEVDVNALASPSVLDQWILARLNETGITMTTALEAYEIDRGARPIFDFVDDLSTWYIRRSRDRMKTSPPAPLLEKERVAQSAEATDKEYALATTRYVLQEFAKLIAPYVPFVADEVYQSLDEEGRSVHLAEWPVYESVDDQSIATMKEVREIISRALELRAEAKIKVRQPLAKLSGVFTQLSEQYIELIKDEVNVKEVVGGEVLELSTEITPELQAEGDARELIRHIQSMRKDGGLNPDDRITLTVETNKAGQRLVQDFSEEMKQIAGISEIVFTENTEGEEIAIRDIILKLTILVIPDSA